MRKLLINTYALIIFNKRNHVVMPATAMNIDHASLRTVGTSFFAKWYAIHMAGTKNIPNPFVRNPDSRQRPNTHVHACDLERLMRSYDAIDEIKQSANRLSRFPVRARETNPMVERSIDDAITPVSVPLIRDAITETTTTVATPAAAETTRADNDVSPMIR